LLDSYSEVNQDTSLTINVVHPADDAGEFSAVGQAFTAGDNYNVTACKFYIKKTGSPTGDLIAKLYNATGTVGTNAVPTGAALASSNTLDASTITASYVLYEFTFSSPQAISNGNDYVIVLEGDSDPLSTINLGVDNSSPSHSGNGCYYSSTGWNASATDVCFYLYGY